MNLFKKLSSMKLLLIDDDEWIRDALKLFFESEGCHIVALETAEEGLAFVKDRKFDLIIADYRLPGMNGLEFIRQLPANQDKALKILITAYGSKDVFSEAQRIGVHDCIPKPFTSEIIEASLKHLISNLN
jgi:DNA-binding NtrC family response regulator